MITQRIGVDVDGVLADFNGAFIDRVIEVTGRDLFPPRPFDIPTWNYPEYYGYTTDELNKVWKSIEQDVLFWQRLPQYGDAAEALDYLHARMRWCGDDVYFITSRPGLLAKQQTETWLRSRDFPHPTVLISSAKDLCADALKLTVYIDDRWENAYKVAQTNARTFLMTRPWNTEYVAEAFGVTRTSTVVGLVEAAALPVAAAPTTTQP